MLTVGLLLKMKIKLSLDETVNFCTLRNNTWTLFSHKSCYNVIMHQGGLLIRPKRWQLRSKLDYELFLILVYPGSSPQAVLVNRTRLWLISGARLALGLSVCRLSVVPAFVSHCSMVAMSLCGVGINTPSQCVRFVGAWLCMSLYALLICCMKWSLIAWWCQSVRWCFVT